MQQRSRFLTFFLSCIPGVGHLYLGLMTRGFTFLVAFFGWIMFVVFLCFASRQDGFMVLFLALPILWFYSFFDALHQRRRLAEGEQILDISPITEFTQGAETGKRSKVWALVFSFIPGAGHMYLGFRDQGLQLMVTFFLSLFVMDWLHMTFMIFLIPIIWFYSMFDALQKASQPAVSENEDFFFVNWLRQNHRLFGYLLIGMGLFLIINKIALRYYAWLYNEYIQTIVVSLLLIGGGIKLLRGSRIVHNDPDTHPAKEPAASEDIQGFEETMAAQEQVEPFMEASLEEVCRQSVVDSPMGDYEIKPDVGFVAGQDAAETLSESPGSGEDEKHV